MFSFHKWLLDKIEQEEEEMEEVEEEEIRRSYGSLVKYVQILHGGSRKRKVRESGTISHVREKEKEKERERRSASPSLSFGWVSGWAFPSLSLYYTWHMLYHIVLSYSTTKCYHLLYCHPA
jgi:hypothetical protein